MESFTPERCFDWLRDERHVSLMMSAAATLNKKPSARKFAPFSMALRVGWSLKADECAWQVPPTDPFVVSTRNDTWSVREIRTPFETARVLLPGS